jgi:hypothetical protein
MNSFIGILRFKIGMTCEVLVACNRRTVINVTRIR